MSDVCPHGYCLGICNARACRVVVAGPGPCDRGPAEQDDERDPRLDHGHSDVCDEHEAWRDATRPSADTETLRVTVEMLVQHYSSVTVVHPAASLMALLRDLRAALDGAA